MTWELGGGIGHLSNLRQIAIPLLENGHEIFFAVKNLTYFQTIFAGLDVSPLQAPVYNNYTRQRHPVTSAFLQILLNKGYGNIDVLKSHMDAWRNIFDLIRPDLLIFDHSPTAMVSSRGLKLKRILTGSGFICPPPDYPLGVYSPERLKKDQINRLCKEDDLISENINRVLIKYGVNPIKNLADIYRDIDRKYLMTYPEFDHYGNREKTRYYGIWPESTGSRPDWPAHPGKKIYAYLKPFEVLPSLLQFLKDSSHPVVVFIHNPPEKLIRKYQSKTLKIVDSPLDLAYASQQCDFAIVHANHGTTTRMFLHGVPCVMIPLQKEQFLYAERAANLGFGVFADKNSENSIIMSLKKLITDPQYKKNVRDFSYRYQDHIKKNNRSEIISSIQDLMNRA